MLIFCKNSWKMDMPTKMALVQHLNGLKIQNGWHHRVLHEKIYTGIGKLKLFEIFLAFLSQNQKNCPFLGSKKLKKSSKKLKSIKKLKKAQIYQKAQKSSN
jgi:hypothetical protein